MGPKGWPVQVDWSSFKGPSKGCSLPLCTEIICQMLEAQDIDPMSYSEQAAEEAAEEDAEMDNEIETEEVHEEEEPNQVGRKRNISDMLARQAWEETNLPAFKRRRQNMQELARKLQDLESELLDGEVVE